MAGLGVGARVQLLRDQPSPTASGRSTPGATTPPSMALVVPQGSQSFVSGSSATGSDHSSKTTPRTTPRRMRAGQRGRSLDEAILQRMDGIPPSDIGSFSSGVVQMATGLRRRHHSDGRPGGAAAAAAIGASPGPNYGRMPGPAGELNMNDGRLRSTAAWDKELMPAANGGAGVCEAMRRVGNLRTVRLGNSKGMQEKHGADLAAALRGRSHDAGGGLLELDMSTSELSVSAMQGIVELLKASRRLEILSFRACKFTQPGVLRTLAQALRDVPRAERTLRELDLSSLSGFTPRAGEWVDLLGALTLYVELEVLNLAANQLGTLPLKNLSLVFGGVRSLCRVDICGSGHDPESRKWLFDALRRRICDGLQGADSVLLLDDDIPMDCGWTDLQYAVVAGDEGGLRGTLSRRASEVHRRDAYWRTTVHLCAAGGSASCLHVLLADLELRYLAKETLLIVNFEDRYGATALDAAACRCHLECTRQLLNAGAGVTTRCFESALRLHVEHADCIAREQEKEDEREQGMSTLAAPDGTARDPFPSIGNMSSMLPPGTVPSRLISLRTTADVARQQALQSQSQSQSQGPTPTRRMRRDSMWQRERQCTGPQARHDECDKARSAVWEQLRLLSPHAHGPLRSVALRVFIPGFLFYALFLATLTLVAAGHSTNFSTEDFMSVRGIRDKLQGAESIGVEDAEQLPDMSTMSTTHELWSWAGKVLLNVVREASVDDSIGVVGAVRMRQLRVRNGTCDGRRHENTGSGTCYGRYTKQNEDLSPLIRAPNSSSEHVWEWSELHEPGALNSELGHTYGGGGYVELLPRDPEEAGERVNQLEKVQWVDDATRAIFIDLTFFKRDTAEYVACHLLFEIPQTGGIHPTLDIISIGHRGGAQFAFFEISMSLFLVWFFLVEVQDLMEMRGRELQRYALQVESRGRSQLSDRGCRRRALSSIGRSAASYARHLGTSWNALDYCLLVLLALGIWKRSQLGNAQAALPQDLENRGEGFVSFAALSNGTRDLRDILGGLVALAWVKSLKYMVILPVVGPTVDAIVATVVNTNILSFLTLFLIISASLSLGLHFTLGNNTEEFSSPSGAGLAFFRMIFGDFNVQHFTAHTSVMGEVLFVTCLISANFILLNILIAVIGHEYDEQLRIHLRGWQDRMIVEYEKVLRSRLSGGAGTLRTVVLSRVPLLKRWSAPCDDANNKYSFATAHYVIDRNIVLGLQRDREPPASIQTLMQQLHQRLGSIEAQLEGVKREHPSPTGMDTPSQTTSLDGPLNMTVPMSGADQRASIRAPATGPGSLQMPLPEMTRWQADRRCAKCNQCQAEFGVSRRRHHCRSCGLIFCAQCSARRCYVVGKGKREVRVCDGCYGAAASTSSQQNSVSTKFD
eukprot:TRINITY_DN26233_c0_g1_i1.p1 TRINITY_DN26233_c0_g1~~TRINITY_DN26233_c0_g1_i1.p1  ORF type:complete len:1378 (+),score=271.23 TRINITY_DN26233_c0_g1_i1:66-4199(+)